MTIIKLTGKQSMNSKNTTIFIPTLVKFFNGNTEIIWVFNYYQSFNFEKVIELYISMTKTYQIQPIIFLMYQIQTNIL